MVRRNSQRLAVLVCFAMLLAGCKKSTLTTKTTGAGSLETKNAQSAVRTITAFASPSVGPFLRPGPKLGVFTSLYIAENGYLPVFSAMKGVNAQMKLHSVAGSNDTNTYALLQEFGSVLSVDIPDLLNRSTDRSRTLNEYMSSLANITTRSQAKAEELKTQAAGLEADRRSAQTDVTTIQRTVNTAIHDKDYATAAAEQEKLSEAQTRQSKADVQLKLTQNISQTLKQLLDLSARRSNAIEQNRAIIVAGLGVVQVPGIEDLNILKTGTKTKSTTGGGGFFSF